MLPDITQGSMFANEAEANFRQFCFFQNEQSYTVPSLYVLLASVRDAKGKPLFYISPRLGYFSKLPGCGKTLAMELTTLMCPNGQILVNPTPPSLVMAYDKERLTCGFDEFDQYRHNGTMMAVINSGYKRGAAITKVRSEEIVKEEVYGPMVLGGKNLNLFLTSNKFDTVRTRTHVIIMDEKPEDAEVDDWDPEIYEPRLQQLGNQIRDWGITHGPHIIREEVDDIIPKGIHSRPKEIWKPLFQVAKYIDPNQEPGGWVERCIIAARAFALNDWGDQTPVKSPSAELLDWVRSVFGDEEKLSSEDIVNRLLELPTEHWWKNEWKSDKMRAATMSLSRMLAIHGIKHTKLRIGNSTPWGYTRTDLGLPECSNRSNVPTSSDVPTVPTRSNHEAVDISGIKTDEYGYVITEEDMEDDEETAA